MPDTTRREAIGEASDRISNAIQAESPISVDGIAYDLRMIRFREPLPHETQAFKIVVEATGGGHSHRVELAVGQDTLEDTEYMTTSAVNGVTKVIRGQLPPGVIEQL